MNRPILTFLVVFLLKSLTTFGQVCSGTPVPGTTAATATSICESTTVTFSLPDFTSIPTTVFTSDLIITEYVEGTANNKYIEIYNGTGADVDLSTYVFKLYANGATTPNFTSVLSGILAHGATRVYRNTSATTYTGLATPLSTINFNGNDAFVLGRTLSTEIVDIIGNIGEFPINGWTSNNGNDTYNKTLRRNSSVTAGVTADPALGFPTLQTEWTSFPVDNVSGLGSHEITTTGSGPFSYSWQMSTDGINFEAINGQTESEATISPAFGTYYIRCAVSCGSMVFYSTIATLDVTGQSTYYYDADADGYGDISTSIAACEMPLGYTDNDSDCVDSDATINPSVVEICNGLDDDCNGIVDDGIEIQTCFEGVGACEVSGDLYCFNGAYYCTAIANEPTAEVCNGIDDDCNGISDDGITTSFCSVGIGECYSAGEIVCDNGIFICSAIEGTPTAETCNDLDDDCDGTIDNNLPLFTFFVDNDGDGFGDNASVVFTCSMPEGYVNICGDCNDNDMLVNPSSSEMLNGFDDDCNSFVDDVCKNIDSASVKIIAASPTSVWVYFSAMNDASVYNVQFRAVGALTWSSSIVSTSNAILISGLTAATNYEYRIRTKCNGAFTSYSTARPFATKAATGTCVKPIPGSVTAISVSSAKLYWDFIPGAVKYSIRYRNLNSPTWILKTISPSAGVLSPTTGVSNLIAGATYVYQIRALCANNVWTSYSSPLDYFTMPSVCGVPTATSMLGLNTESNDAAVVVSTKTTDGTWQIWPNPAHDNLHIARLSTTSEAVKLSLFDLTGRTLLTRDVIDNSFDLDVSSLPTGVYVLRIGTEVSRIVVE